MGNTILCDALWFLIDGVCVARGGAVYAGKNPARSINFELDLDWSVDTDSAPNCVIQNGVRSMARSSKIVRLQHSNEA